MAEDIRQPLVTVAVITYNSAQFVVETLDSIKAQTYSEVELIISDDASKDDTIQVCKQWVSQNQDRFVRSIVLESKQNTGISGNCNRALKASKGVWFKLIAGDDLLEKHAISEFVLFSHNRDKIDAIVCDCSKYYPNRINGKCLELMRTPNRYLLFNKYSTAIWQYNLSKFILLAYGPCTFIRTKVLKQIDGYDERFPMQEDQPLFLALTKNNVMIHYLSKPLIRYRIYETSVTHSRNKHEYYTPSSIRILTIYQPIYVVENLGFIWHYLYKYSLFLTNKVIKTGNSKIILSCRLWHYLQKTTDPVFWYKRFLVFLNFILSKI